MNVQYIIKNGLYLPFISILMYFIVGDNFESFKDTMQSLAPFCLFGVVFLARMKFTRKVLKKKNRENNLEINLYLTYIDKLKSDLKKSFLFILGQTDLVKFADVNLPNEKSIELLNLSREFVEKTMPRENLIEQESVV